MNALEVGAGPFWVKTRIYRAATATAASPQSADMPRQAPSPIAEYAMRHAAAAVLPQAPTQEATTTTKVIATIIAMG